MGSDWCDDDLKMRVTSKGRFSVKEVGGIVDGMK